jgi:hypothetical protein
MGYGFAGSVSPKAAKKANAKLQVLRQTRAQRGKMAAFDGKSKDEGKVAGGAGLHRNEIDAPATQSKQGAVGRVSTGGGIGKPESHVTVTHIDQPENRKTWPKGGGVSAGNPKTGNTRMKGPIARSGGLYGGGGRNTQ